MPHSLRTRLSGLRYKKIISDKDYDRLRKALDNENVLDKIRAEIEHIGGDDEKAFCKNLNESYKQGLKDALKVIDKYKAESEDKKRDSDSENKEIKEILTMLIKHIKYGGDLYPFSFKEHDRLIEIVNKWLNEENK